ncbi:MAG: hemerythrin domain-containing protein [Phycisphaerae bacterium]|jgi:hemerythrin-like domain-containing protein|nr:hemerythrin domain-containing protein [Phycisphaerae bacterium]HOO16457.1 hemerythrin domain-containing protein [Phycisphaerae bacterium]HPC22140.1 hemerythrin domain-containing protein [Phycisphaerae bacterium]HRS27165.1 hemerythrin domain-containing protein [Phycisphaerae bacterium]HRT41003.1 hemerythrin domain-containing protein [Phycisphaerae bacterium]
MNPHDLANWIRQERARVDELSYLVRKHLAVPPPTGRARWIPEVRECFRRLSDHMRRHMALEESEGYMNEVRKLRPALSRELDRLQHEHGELCRLMDHIQVGLDEMQPEDNLIVRSYCAQIGMLLSYVERHEEEEQNLVVYAFSEDIPEQD